MPKVLHKFKDVIPPEAVYVGRGSPWGNPFVLGPDGDRKTVLKKFCDEVLLDLDVSLLKGKDLVCFCAPKECHADLLLEKANKVKFIVPRTSAQEIRDTLGITKEIQEAVAKAVRRENGTNI